MGNRVLSVLDETMLFHSIDYILFLTLVVIGFWSLVRHGKARIIWLFLASCRFYMVWHPAYVGLILASSVIDWLVGRNLPKVQNPKKKKAVLSISILWNLGVLGIFKYFNFFSQSVEAALGFLGISVSMPFLNVLLPVGISFYTFQTMSYTIDVYRGKIQPEPSLLNYATYLLFFPPLVAGPIVRAADLLPQLRGKPGLSQAMVGEGVFLIMRGLLKKVIVADYLALNLVNRAFDNPAAFTSLEMLVALYAYTMQIYCDFSGYTDVARGSAMLMGIKLPENFKRPYKATSPAAFWRNWHMTLSSWLRDYVYFPLGGSKCSPARTYFNLWLTLFLIGIWHGAGWNFVIYGTIHGLAMVIHRYFYKRSGRTKDTVDPKWMIFLKILGTFHFVVLSRILFRADSLSSAWTIVKQLAKGTTSLAQISTGLWVLLGVTYLIHWLPVSWTENLKALYIRMPAVVQGLIFVAAAAVMVKLAATQVVPYIYFQF